jgi:hypothetical protein
MTSQIIVLLPDGVAILADGVGPDYHPASQAEMRALV